MNNNFDNKVMMNDGIEAMGSGVNHKSMTNGQIAATVLICSIIAAGAIKGVDWLRKRKQAKKHVEVVDSVEAEDIEITE